MSYPALLTRYIFRQLLTNVLMAWVTMSVLVLLFVVLKMAQFLEHINIDGGAVVYVIPALLPQALFFALPISALIGSVLTFGRLNAEGEILGIRAAGGRPALLMLPCLLLGILLSALAWPLADQWMDLANAYSGQRINAAALEQIQQSYRPGNVVSIPLSGNGRICTVAVQEKIGGRQPVNMSIFKGFEVTYLGYAANHTELEVTLWAGHCDLEFVKDESDGASKLPRRLRFHLEDVTLTTLMPAAPVESVVRFEKYIFDVPLSNESFSGFSLIASLSDIRDQQVSDTASWRQAKRNLAAEPLLVARAEAEAALLNATNSGLGAWAIPADAPADPFLQPADLDPAVPGHPLHPRARITTAAHTENLKRVDYFARARMRKDLEYGRKVAAIFAPVALLILGLGLGLMVRRQSPFVGFIVGLVGYGLLFYPLSLLGRILSLQWELPALWGQFLPNLLLLGIGLFLIRWQTSPSADRLGRITSWLRGLFRRRKAPAESATPATPAAPAAQAAAVAETAGVSVLAAQAAPVAGGRMAPARWYRSRVLEGHILSMFLTPFLGTLCGVLLLFITLDVMENIEHINNFVEISSRTAAQGDLIPLGRTTAYQLIGEYLIFNALNYILRFNGITVLAAAVFALVVMNRSRETLIIKAAGCDLRRRLLIIPLVGLILSLTLSALQEFSFKTVMREQNWVYERMKGKSARVAQAQTRLYRGAGEGSMTGPGAAQTDYVLDVGRYHLEAKRALDFHLREFRVGATWPVEYAAPLAIWRADPFSGTGGGVWEFPAGGERRVREPAADDPKLLSATVAAVDRVQVPFSPDPFEVAEAELASISLQELWKMESQPEVAAEIWSRLAALVLIPALLLWLMPLQLKMGWHPAKGAGLGGLIAFAGIGTHYVLKFSVPAIYAIDPLAVPTVLLGLHGLLLAGGLIFYWRSMET